VQKAGNLAASMAAKKGYWLELKKVGMMADWKVVKLVNLLGNQIKPLWEPHLLQSKLISQQ